MIRSGEIHLPRGNASGGVGVQVGWEGEAKMAGFPTEQALQAAGSAYGWEGDFRVGLGRFFASLRMTVQCSE